MKTDFAIMALRYGYLILFVFGNTISRHPLHAQQDSFFLILSTEHIGIIGKADRNLVMVDSPSIVKQLAQSSKLATTHPDSSLFLARDALRKSFALHFDYGIALSYCKIANYEDNRGNYDISLQYYSKALPFALKGFKNPNTLAMFYTSVSGNYFHESKYDSMSLFSYKAEQLLNKAPIRSHMDAGNVSNVYTTLGALWATVGDYSKAKVYLRKALHNLEPYKKYAVSKTDISLNYSNLGFIYSKSGDDRSAENNYREALKYDQNNFLAVANLGGLLTRNRRINEAAEIFKQVEYAGRKLSNYYTELVINVALGDFYFESDQLEKAKKILKEVVDLVEQKESKGLPDQVYEAYFSLSNIYAREGQFRQAYDYENKGRVVRDEQMKREKTHEIYNLEIKSQTALKDKEIAQEKLLINVHKNRLHEKNIWLGAISGSSVLFVIALLALYRNSRHKQKLQLEKITLINREQEINNLKAMIRGEEKERTRVANELHDGIMVQLSTVKMSLKSLPESYRHLSVRKYRETDHYRQMVQQMEDATSELRRTAHNLMPDMLLQGGITDAVSYFCASLQQAGLNISYQQYGNIPRLPQDFELSIFRIVQELLQNVMKHAAARKIMVQLAEVEDRILTVSVEDDGKGFDTQLSEAGKGMGLKSIQSRVQVLKGHMDVRSCKGDGTTIYLEFEMPESRILTATQY